MTANAFRTLSAAVVILLAGSFTYTAAQTVTGSIADGKAQIGKPTRVTVVLDIPAELHTNSNAPGSEYAIPTTVKATAEGVKVGPITYPPGKSKKFEFSENELNIYEGRVEFGFDITVPKGYKKYSVVVDVAVRYQACTNEVCYPPKTKKITLSAPVI